MAQKSPHGKLPDDRTVGIEAETNAYTQLTRAHVKGQEPLFLGW